MSHDRTQTEEQICFVAMPVGDGEEEKSHYRGWYTEVTQPAVEDCGYKCVLAADGTAPNAIDDEIRSRLAESDSPARKPPYRRRRP